MIHRYAVLITCFNRVETTLACLRSIEAQELNDSVLISIYLVDDASPDQTGSIVAKTFPAVKVLKGNGKLFWAGGMRYAMKVAQSFDYDGYILINDDVQLQPDALQRLIEVNEYSLKCYGKKGVYVGSTINPKNGKISYGGRKLSNRWTGKNILLNPSDNTPVSCDMSHANILLVMREVLQEVSFFPPVFIHRLADYDFTLRVRKASLPLLIAPGYYGCCEDDHGRNWLSNSHSLKERISFLKNPKHLAYDEHFFYLKHHFPLSVPLTFIKLWIKTLFPSVWSFFKPVNPS